MKYYGFVWSMIVMALIPGGPLGSSLADQPASSALVKPSAQEPKTEFNAQNPKITGSQQKSGEDKLPVYKPPQRGTPGARVGGGTRGHEEDLPVLTVLAPDHTGLTVQSQPTLYWYLSKPTAYPIEVTLIEEKAVKPLLEVAVPNAGQPGVYGLRLADYGVELAPETAYRWFVTLVVDPDRRSKDALAGGMVQRVASPESLTAKLVQADGAEVPNIYAEAGIWYDALGSATELINAAPNEPLFKKKRAALLDQVGLSEVSQD